MCLVDWHHDDDAGMNSPDRESVLVAETGVLMKGCLRDVSQCEDDRIGVMHVYTYLLESTPTSSNFLFLDRNSPFMVEAVKVQS